MRTLVRGMLLSFVSVVCLIHRPVAGEQNGGGVRIQVGANSIGGVVVNNAGGGPEAGVWVIAETKALQVPFRKIVVTDDQGRFLAPDLPKGDYELWVRGYGLRDSSRSKGAPGGQVRLTVDKASTPPQDEKRYNAPSLHPFL